MRLTLNQDLGFSNEDRVENNRRIAHVARNFMSQVHQLLLVSLIRHQRF